jgi:transposase
MAARKVNPKRAPPFWARGQASGSRPAPQQIAQRRKEVLFLKTKRGLSTRAISRALTVGLGTVNADIGFWASSGRLKPSTVAKLRSPGRSPAAMIGPDNPNPRFRTLPYELSMASYLETHPKSIPRLSFTGKLVQIPPRSMPAERRIAIEANVVTLKRRGLDNRSVAMVLGISPKQANETIKRALESGKYSPQVRAKLMAKGERPKFVKTDRRARQKPLSAEELAAQKKRSAESPYLEFDMDPRAHGAKEPLEYYPPLGGKNPPLAELFERLKEEAARKKAAESRH